MRFTFRLSTLVLICFSFTSATVLVACSVQQAKHAQATLQKVEAATTQAADVAGGIAANPAVPTPFNVDAATIAAIFTGLLAVEKAVGTYVIPFLTKKDSQDGSDTQSASNSKQTTNLLPNKSA